MHPRIIHGDVIVALPSLALEITKKKNGNRSMENVLKTVNCVLKL